MQANEPSRPVKMRIGRLVVETGIIHTYARSRHLDSTPHIAWVRYVNLYNLHWSLARLPYLSYRFVTVGRVNDSV